MIGNNGYLFATRRETSSSQYNRRIYPRAFESDSYIAPSKAAAHAHRNNNPINRAHAHKYTHTHARERDIYGDSKFMKMDFIRERAAARVLN